VLFFSANDGLTGPALWRSDGTAAGTILVEDINPLSTEQFESLIIPLAGVNGRLLFIANDGKHGRELWASDGSPEGTSLVRDVAPGMADAFEFSFQPSFADFYGTLFFPAFDPATGTELWRSDGTEAGTMLAADINPGMGSSTVRYLTTAGGRLYFSADNGMTGSELWKWEGDLAFLVNVDPDGMTSDITIRRNGPNLEVINNGDASLVASRPAADVGRVHVAALPAGADRFTVDFRNGEFALSRGLTFDGGPAPLDELAIVGGRVGSAELRSTGAAAGTASLDRFDVFHTGVAELTLEVEIGAISFVETVGGDQSYVFNVDGSRGSDLLVLGGANPFTGVRFTTPHESLHINMGEGRDWARLHAVSGRFPAAIMIEGGGGFDSLELVDLPDTAVAATLASDSVTGLAGFAGPIRYAALDQIDLGLGTAAPGHWVSITGTPTFETTVHLSSGADSVMVESFAGALMIHAGDGDDSFTATAAGLDAALGGLFLLGEADSDRFLVSSRVGGEVRGGDPVGHDAATILGSDGPDALLFEGASGQPTSVLNRNLRIHDLDELTIEGGPGDDEIDASLAPSELGDLTLAGGSGNDRLTGGPGADRLLGGSDNDTMVGGPGNDTMDGGDGTDTIDFSSAPGAVTVQLQSAANRRSAARARAKPNRRTSSATGDGNDSLAGIEGVIGSRFNDVITGDSSANRLDGGDGNDQLRGGDGDDILIGGLGDDRLYGDAGADTLTGDAGDDYLRGGAHSDQLTGGPGIDQLLGDAGFDRLLADMLDRLKKGGAGDEVILS
jgi:ELWxxDGT repeat protein